MEEETVAEMDLEELPQEDATASGAVGVAPNSTRQIGLQPRAKVSVKLETHFRTQCIEYELWMIIIGGGGGLDELQ